MGIPPLKHVVQTALLGTNIGAAVTTVDIIEGVENPDPYTNFTNVRNGSIVRQIHLYIDYDDSLVGTPVVFDWAIWFNIQGNQTPIPNPSNMNVSKLKNQVFHQDGCLTSLTQATSVGVTDHIIAKWRLVINVPKTFQTINFGDKIQLILKNSANNSLTNIKIMAIYKEIFP